MMKATGTRACRSIASTRSWSGSKPAEYRIDRYDLLTDRAQAFVHDPFGNLVELTN